MLDVKEQSVGGFGAGVIHRRLRREIRCALLAAGE
jgi:hypothetical protein